MKKYIQLIISVGVMLTAAFSATHANAQAPVSATAVEGKRAAFITNVQGSSPFTYVWKKGGVVIASATASSYVIPSVVLSDDGVYTVTISNSIGSITTPTATLTIWSMPKFNGPLVGGTVAEGAAFTLTSPATAVPAPTYQWSKGGVAISGATSASYSIAAAVLTDAGDYTVTATNSAGSVTSNVGTLVVTGSPPTLKGFILIVK